MLFLAIYFGSCGIEQQAGTSREEALIFPRGEKITNSNFVGQAWLTSLITADSVNQNAVGSVTFEPSTSTNWHSHPSGQIVMALAGKVYYQEKGSPKVILRNGDVTKCPANVPHWHGASTDSQFIQIAITRREKGETVWLQPVTEEEYIFKESGVSSQVSGSVMGLPNFLLFQVDSY